MRCTPEALVLRGPAEWPRDETSSLAEALANALQRHGDRVALVHGVTGDSLTYAQLLARSRRVAQRLRALGLDGGDVMVGVCSENNIEFAVAIIGALFAGASFAPLNPAYTARELMHSLHISKPCLVFCSTATAPRVEEVRKRASYIRHVVVFGDAQFPDHVAFSSLLGPGPEIGGLLGPGKADGNRVIAVLCSSGTTGLAKGVTLSERNFITCLGHMTDPRFSEYSLERDVLLAILPFFHAYGCVSLIGILFVGIRAVMLPRFEEKLFLETIQNHKVTMLFLVPPLMVFLGKHPLVDRYDLSSLRAVSCGAAPLSDELQKLVTTRLRIPEVRQGYGMTETTLGVLRTPPGRNKLGSSGLLAPGVECKVVDPTTGQALGAHARGELCFRGPMVMAGYFGDARATAQCTDAEGFLRTGDVGYYDEEGFFFVVDRLKELIKYKGYQVPPAELEAVLLSHPEVRDAAVVGVPDEAAGELPLAFVVRQAASRVTEQQIADFVAERVSSSKRLRGGVRFVDFIPKNPSGKILRRELRARL